MKHRLSKSVLIFCSRECSNFGRLLSYEVRGRNLWEISCAVCGNDMRKRIGITMGEFHRGVRIFNCSRECREAANSLFRNISDNRTTKFNTPKINCEICGKEFTNNSKTRRFCSKSCMGIDNHNKYVDGKSSINEMLKKAKKALYGVSGNTYIEQRMKEYLLNEEIKFEDNIHINIYNENGKFERTYWPDIVILDRKIDIECDGEYWHTRKENMLRDRIRDDKLSKLGWTVLRFSGKDINSNIDYCIYIIKENLK
jgi:very-short-patch-repair endonuclease/endogenous inhibitor of DNA gyrase (YacG/DUF329 family)